MAETTIDARVTMYGFPDNDPPFSANIAHPVLHQQANGIGTFDDPITFAGDPGDIPFGTKIYVPHVQKYFVMEDTCAEAMASPNDRLHVDLWAGGSANTDVQQILSVENANTRSSAQIILNAEPGHPVNLTPFDGGGSKKGSIGTDSKDNLKGAATSDVYQPMKGNDKITTGAGQDIVQFKEGDGKDQVTDFTRGQDKIELDVNIGGNSIDSFAELQSLVGNGINVTSTKKALVVAFDNGDELTLTGVTNLDAQDWLLV